METPPPLSIPIISLTPTPTHTRADMARQIASACISPGFFQVTSHSLSPTLLNSFRSAMEDFFALPATVKNEIRRNGRNSRGYFDNELTKRKMDWKECIDVGAIPKASGDGTGNLMQDGVPPCLDGVNQWPEEEVVKGFRKTVADYFEGCGELADGIAMLMVLGLELEMEERRKISEDDITAASSKSAGHHEESVAFVTRMKSNHTSYLRMNHYPPCTSTVQPPPLGIGRHTDAGFLTILVQDDDCHSLQVLTGSNNGDEDEGKWVTVVPTPGALTINTGDMAQIFSGGLFRAPPHRVLTARKDRYSAPFFYNPGYDELVSVAGMVRGNEVQGYNRVLWGYFRVMRFAGDLSDWGVDEIQIKDYHEDRETKSSHLVRQVTFKESANFDEPFDVEEHRELLSSS